MFQQHIGSLMVAASAAGFATLTIFIKLKNIPFRIGAKAIVHLCLMDPAKTQTGEAVS